MGQRSARCRRLVSIESKLTDRTIDLYEEGKMVDFWDAVDALNSLSDIVEKLCGEGKK